MKRFVIAFQSMSTGMGLEYDAGETAADALKKAQQATKEGLRHVRIVDSSTQEALDLIAFAAKHRL